MVVQTQNLAHIPTPSIVSWHRLVLVSAALQHHVRKTITGNKKEFSIRLCFGLRRSMSHESLLENCLHSPSKANINRVICLNLIGLAICVPPILSSDLTHSCLHSESQAQLFCAVVCSLLTEADAGHTEFTDEVFQNETRFPGGDWQSAAEPYTDVVNAQHMHKSTHLQTCFQKPWTTSDKKLKIREQKLV